MMVSVSDAASAGVKFGSKCAHEREVLIPGMRNQDGKLEEICRLIVAGWSFRSITILTRSAQETVSKAAKHLKAMGIKYPKATMRKRVDGTQGRSWMGWNWVEKQR